MSNVPVFSLIINSRVTCKSRHFIASCGSEFCLAECFIYQLTFPNHHPRLSKQLTDIIHWKQRVTLFITTADPWRRRLTVIQKKNARNSLQRMCSFSVLWSIYKVCFSRQVGGRRAVWEAVQCAAQAATEQQAAINLVGCVLVAPPPSHPRLHSLLSSAKQVQGFPFYGNDNGWFSDLPVFIKL